MPTETSSNRIWKKIRSSMSELDKWHSISKFSMQQMSCSLQLKNVWRPFSNLYERNRTSSINYKNLSSSSIHVKVTSWIQQLNWKWEGLYTFVCCFLFLSGWSLPTPSSVMIGLFPHLNSSIQRSTLTLLEKTEKIFTCIISVRPTL